MIESIFRHKELSTYSEIWDLQKEKYNSKLSAKLKGDKNQINYLIACQHKHVITIGKSGKESNIQIPEFPDVEYIRIDRGGDITYHGPGQLVVYPILDLEQFNLSLKQYIFILEEAVIKTLSNYGIEAGRIKEYTGVWLNYDSNNARKIAAIGVKSSRHITMHGLAFNIKTDLNYFDLIVPCGIKDKAVTSLQKEFQNEVDFNEVSQVFLNTFLKLLE